MQHCRVCTYVRPFTNSTVYVIQIPPYATDVHVGGGFVLQDYILLSYGSAMNVKNTLTEDFIDEDRS